jgi:glycosyltransferase involved in cell wall biosynthesis
MIKNISFIVIARNESFAVDKCLASISTMGLINCEIICVDSDSTDNTLVVMKSYAGKIENLKVIQISGYLNAAVARNAGMQHATKDYIYFVDGDVELYPEFIIKALDRIKAGKSAAVTGKLMEIQYSPDYQNEIRRLVRRKMMADERKCLMTGGIFIATKEIVAKAGVFDSSFFRLQDFDYTLRISRHGTLLQLPQFIGVHHTQEFHDRSWEHFKKGFPRLYGRLIRKNLDCPSHIVRLLRGNRGLATFLLFTAVILCGLSVALLLSFPLIYVLVTATICFSIDCIYSTIIKHVKINQWLLHNYLEPPMVLFGLLIKPKVRPTLTQVREVV